MEFVRRAEASDLALIEEMYRACVSGSAGTRGSEMYGARESFPDVRSSIDALVASEDLILVSGIDDVTLGFALARLETLRTSALHVVIDALYVDPEARAVGLGEMMMEKILEWSKQSGASSVDAIALPGDRETKNFFEMSGFTARLIVMHHKLDK